MEEKRKSNLIWKLLFGLFGVIFIGLAVVFIVNMYQQKKMENAYENIVEQDDAVSEIIIPEEEKSLLKQLGIEIPEKEIDFKALQQENEDIYAWIYIPGVEVDYPILQHPTDEAYYLNHNIDGSSGLPGVIYTEAINNKDFMDPHTVIYGHNMNNGTMFGALHDYEDSKVFDENQYFFIYTPEKVFVYHIFAAYEYNAVHLIYNFDLENPDIYQNYLDQIFEIRDINANIRRDVEVDAEDHVVTLSTCVRGKKNMRYLVQGVLLNGE